MHIIGFAKAVGDIRDGARGVLAFFGVAFVITAVLMLWFVKDVKLTRVALVVAMMPVLWLLGTLPHPRLRHRPAVDPRARSSSSPSASRTRCRW